MAPVMDALDVALWIIIIYTLAIDILSYHYRHLASQYIYLHILQLTVARLLPNGEVTVFVAQPT